MVMAVASRKAALSAITSPNRFPAPMPPPTMISTPISITPMAISVAGFGRSFRNSQERSAANMELKARMNTRLAVEVL